MLLVVSVVVVRLLVLISVSLFVSMLLDDMCVVSVVLSDGLVIIVNVNGSILSFVLIVDILNVFCRYSGRNVIIICVYVV